MIAGNAVIKEARKAAGLTQSELAERMGTTQSVIARLESPQANPRLDTMLRAVAATGHDLDAHLKPTSAPVDESLIAANLRLEPAERLRRFAAAYRSVSGMARKAKVVGGP
jgi:transcriptional regulator with XRE-family HTH domain